jgi:glycosyltransferase involved in cell wall biosynthesis
LPIGYGLVMKILMVIDSLKGGGKERQLHELLKYMKKHTDFEFEIMSRRRNPEDKEIMSLGYRVHYPRTPSKPRFILDLNTVIRKVNPDLIHSWEGFVTSSSIFLGGLRRTKIVNFDIQYAHRVKILSFLYIHEKLNQLLASRNVANSEAGLRTFHLKKGAKNRVIYNGFDKDRMTAAKPAGLRGRLVPGNAFLVAMTANFTLPKDYVTFIEAGKRILNKRKDVFFILVGDGPERLSVEQHVPRSLRGHFFFLGRRTDVENIVQEIDVGVLLSKKGHAEGLSNSIMEYMAAGKPVVATRTGGNPELVLDGVTGYLIPHQDETELVQKLELFMNDPSGKERMGARGRERIVKDFSLEKMGSEFVNLYRELSGNENRAAN